MAAAKRILRYMKGTLNFYLVYEKGEVGLKLVGYSDSDYGGDLDDRKSIMTERIDAVINYTPIRVKIKSKLTNFMKLIRIEGYNGK